jgi:hypothetical protein
LLKNGYREAGSLNGTSRIEFGLGDSTGAQIVSGKEKDYMTWQNRSGYLAFETVNDNAQTERMRITSSGYVGIGTTIPKAPLHVTNPGSLGQIRMGTGDASNSNAIMGINGNTFRIWNGSGYHKLTLTMDGEYNDGAMLSVSKAQIGGKCVPNGTESCDLAEVFLSLDSATPGDVVSLDPAVFKGLHLASTPYDPAMAGVVSTDPTIVMGQKDVAEGVPVALAGVVPVKVTVEDGPIDIGDPLTSSSTPGHAMKATRPGPTIGKAMERFDGSQGWAGMVRVLVAPSATSGFAEDGDSKCHDEIQEMKAEIRRLDAELKALRRSRR